MSQLFELNKNNLKEISEKNFDLEKDIQNIVESNVEKLFDLKLVKSEFIINNYRLDSLCFDEDKKSFVIIEYKKNQSYSVIDQGYSYLSTMLNNKSDFILEFNENMNASIKRDEIDWSQSRIIFISPSFNSYQKDSVNFRDMPFDLYEIKKFSNKYVSLNKLISESKESINKVTKRNKSLINKVADEIKVYSEDDVLKNRDEVRELYELLKEEVLKFHGSELVAARNYMTLKKNNKIVAYIGVQEKNIEISIIRRLSFKNQVDKAKISYEIKDPKKIFSIHKPDNRREIYRYKFNDEKDFNFLIDVLKHAFDSKK